MHISEILIFCFFSDNFSVGLRKVKASFGTILDWIKWLYYLLLFSDFISWVWVCQTDLTFMFIKMCLLIL